MEDKIKTPSHNRAYLAPCLQQSTQILLRMASDTRGTLDESLIHINKQTHKSSATGFIGGMDNGRNRDSRYECRQYP